MKRRDDRTPRLRWWVYAIPICAFLLGLLLGVLL